MIHIPIFLMPTKKKRVNVTLPKPMAIFIRRMSLRDDVPQSTTIVQLLEQALEIEEDEYWDKRAESIEKKNKGWLTHEKFWKGRV